MTLLTKGDRVRATYDGRTVDGVIAVASSNGISLVLEWGDGMLGGYVGIMPIVQHEGGTYHDLLKGEPVTLERLHNE